MSKVMPAHIKKNFIYRRVWNDVYRKDQNAIFLFIGDIGTGKSTGALKFGEDLDERFSLERVCFTTTELFDLIQKGDSNGKLRPGSVIIFDEAAGSEDAADSRNSLTKSNKILSFFSTISRAKRYIIIYVAPMFSQFDKRIRLIGITGIVLFTGIDREENRGLANFHWSYGLPFSDRTMMPYPRIKNKETGEIFIVNQIGIPKPDEKLIKNYKIKKNAFIDRKIREWRNELVEFKNRKEDKQNEFKRYYNSARKNAHEFLDFNGKISKGKLRVHYKLNDRDAATLKKLLDLDML